MVSNNPRRGDRTGMNQERGRLLLPPARGTRELWLVPTSTRRWPIHCGACHYIELIKTDLARKMDNNNNKTINNNTNNNSSNNPSRRRMRRNRDGNEGCEVT